MLSISFPPKYGHKRSHFSSWPLHHHHSVHLAIVLIIGISLCLRELQQSMSRISAWKRTVSLEISCSCATNLCMLILTTPGSPHVYADFTQVMVNRCQVAFSDLFEGRSTKPEDVIQCAVFICIFEKEVFQTYHSTLCNKQQLLLVIVIIVLHYLNRTASLRLYSSYACDRRWKL